jgi:hypothetical protein
MTTPLDAAAAISRANTDFLLGIATAIQEGNKRWYELGSKVVAEASQAPTVNKAYWDEVAAIAAETRASSLTAVQKAVTDWQAAWTAAGEGLESPFENSAFAALLQPWLPAKPADDAKTPAKPKSATANG